MRVVLDTNVLVSGLLTTNGACGQILAMVFEELLHPCVDDRVLDGYEEILPRPLFDFAPHDVAATLRLMRARGERLTPLPLPVALPHEDDHPFIEVAAAADAILVTGNKRHFPKRSRGGVTVVSCGEFLELLRSG